MHSKFFPVFAVIMLSAISSAWAQERFAKLSLGDVAPQLAVTAIKGDPVNIREQKGENVVIVEFWATWCAPCRDSIPYLTALQKKYKDKGLVIVGVSGEDVNTITPFVEKMGAKMDYTVVADRDRQTWRRYMAAVGEEGIPRAFVIDRSGSLIWHGHPMEPFLEPLLEILLNHEAKASGKERPTPQGDEEQPTTAGTDGAGSGSKS